MAEESGGGSWWSSWDKVFDNVKETSSNVYQLVAKDLQEFVTTIQTDTTEVIAETAHVVKEKLEVDEGGSQPGTASLVKQGVSSWLGNVSSSLKEGITKVSAATLPSPAHPHSSSAMFIDRAKARVEQMQTDPGTYCNEPDGPTDLYMKWCETFNLEDHKGEISELLVNNGKVRALYTNLVPGAVTHSLFWHRYFYKLHQFEEEDKRKAVLMARASQLEQEDLGWGDDDDDMWGGEEMAVLDTEHRSLVASAHEQTMMRDDKIENRPLPETDTLENCQLSSLQTMDCRIVEIHDTGTQNTGLQDELSSRHERTNSPENYSLDINKEHETTLNKNLEDLNVDDADSTSTRTNTEKSGISEDVEDKRAAKADVQIRDEDKDAVENTENEEKFKSTVTISEDNSQSDDSGSFVKVPLNTLQQQNSKSDVSDDGSWAKLSDEDLMKDELMKDITGKGVVMSPGSSSMSSPVHVPPVDDKEEEEEEQGGEDETEDVWDEDFDLEEDIPDEEVQRIVQAMKNKDPSEVAEDDDWEDWD